MMMAMMKLERETERIGQVEEITYNLLLFRFG